MATVSPVVLKCAVCSFESEIFADFQSHRCKLFYSIGHMYNNMQDFTKISHNYNLYNCKSLFVTEEIRQ